MNDNDYIDEAGEAADMNNLAEDYDTHESDSTSKRNGLIKELILYAIIFVLFVFIIPRYVVQLTVVDGRSMTNTLQNNDRLFVEKVSYRFGDPERFDIIVFYPEGRDSDEYYVKRVIGLPGETVQIIDSIIYINGEPLEDNYRKEFYISYNGIAGEPVTLGDDQFFVMGDNRNGSTDSRDPRVGLVERANIDGRVVLRVYPFDKIGLMTDK